MKVRVLGGGEDPLVKGELGTFTTDPRHSIVTHRHIFATGTNICTSFDPNKMTCTHCGGGEHPVLLRGGSTGGCGQAPKCFVLSDQCFPPVLPADGDGDCLAIIQIENGDLAGLVTAFLDLVTGYDLPVGSVVLLSSAAQLLRIGAAAYSEEVVRACLRIREAYGGTVSSLHGIPIFTDGMNNSELVRSLLDIELWLGDTDKKRMHSLPDTSLHLIKELYRPGTSAKHSTGGEHNAYGKARIPYSMPHSMYTLDKVPFVSPGWEDVATHLPTLKKEDESKLLGVLIEELNCKFALQLDPDPLTDRYGQEASGLHDHTDMLNVVFAGGSHSSRMLDQVSDPNTKLLDCTVPGFRLTERSVAEMAKDIKEIASELPAKSTVFIMQLFDNSVYYGCREEGEMLLPKKGADRAYHVEGALKIVKKSTFRDLFNLALTVIKEAGDITVFLTVPLPRYLLEKCCSDPSHISNKYEADYESSMREALADIATWMKSMSEMRRLKNVVIYNPMEPLGLLDDEADEEQILRLWGPDPVHPTEAAYRAISNHLSEAIACHMAAAKTREAAAEETKAPAAPKQKPVRREAWISGTEPVAKRQATTNSYLARGPGHSRPYYQGSREARGRGGNQFPRPWKRGFRGGRGRGGGRRGRG